MAGKREKEKEKEKRAMVVMVDKNDAFEVEHKLHSFSWEKSSGSMLVPIGR